AAQAEGPLQKRKIDGGVLLSGEPVLGGNGSLAQPCQCGRRQRFVATALWAVFGGRVEPLAEELNKRGVNIVTTEPGVPIGGDELEHPLIEFQNRDIEGASPQV